MSDDNSKLVPLLPISNRTVKRLCADDSVHYVCESRSSSDSLQSKKPLRLPVGLFAFYESDNRDLLEVLTTRAAGACCGAG